MISIFVIYPVLAVGFSWISALNFAGYRYQEFRLKNAVHKASRFFPDA